MKKMKLILMMLFVILSTNSFSQLHVDSLYDNKDELLIYSVIYEFDSLSQDVINTKVKNWAGTNFVNMKEVLVSETKEQFVFNYITESFFMKTLGISNYYNWYIRMVIQTKDNKIKISLYDDGNCYWPGSYSGGVSVPATQVREHTFLDYFNKKGTCIKMCNDGLVMVRKSCINTSSDLINSIKSNTNTDNNW
jgi:hypothetical protein